MAKKKTVKKTAEKATKKTTKKTTKKKETAEKVVETAEVAEAASEEPVVEETEIVAEEAEAVAEEPETVTEEVEPVAVETPTEAPSIADELTLGSGVPSAGDRETATTHAPLIRGKIDKFGVAMGTGRRKTSVARVRIKPGSGDLTINGRNLEEYFKIVKDRENILAPLRATQSFGNVDVWVRVNGGGTTGQAGAVVLGIARALETMNTDHHSTLSEGGYLTRDSRMVERKKYGYKKARKSFQFSKR